MSEGISKSVPAVPEQGLSAIGDQPAAKNRSVVAVFPRKSTWFGKLKPYLAPFLITCILIAGNLKYGMLEGNAGTAIAIVTSVLMELVLSRFAAGRWPHLASCYITGISVGILVRSPLLLPYVLCSMLSISSKYALRIKGRHLWNPSNLGVSVMLFLTPDIVSPLSQHWGNEIWAGLIIMGLGSLILYSVGLFHITLTYVATFIVLSVLRSFVTNTLLITEIALLTAPAYQLFIFFMITDPKTTTRTKKRQCAVAVLVAVVESTLRLCREIYAPFYALFIVGPLTNLLEIWWEGGHVRKASSVLVATPQLAEGTGAPQGTV
jgi:hypothetical protein